MWDLFRHAGWAAYPLGLCSILVVAIVAERLVTLRSLRRLEADAFVALQENLERRGSLRFQRDDLVGAAPVARILEATLPLAKADATARAQAADIALAQQRLRLRRFLPGLATIGSTAPFIGLFGTVLGVMTSFHGMATSGLGGEAMATGISEALSATALGLLVAIPAVFAYNYFTGVVQAFLLEIQEHMVRLLARMEAG